MRLRTYNASNWRRQTAGVHHVGEVSHFLHCTAVRQGGRARRRAVGIAVAWLDWQMKKDKRAAKLFVGKNCDLCVYQRQVVRSKKIK
jgi:hypothetical protein